MSEKQAKKFRKLFRDEYGHTKAHEYKVTGREVKKVVGKTDARKALERMTQENALKPKSDREPVSTIWERAPKVGDEYLKKVTRIEADDTRRHYKIEKRRFRHGA